ncbi:putative membrane-associated or secreted trancriptional regulator [Halanaeroarchaeum sp. HSR-CO]|uniref:DUF7345 domain-containing protein n=1 Tax=Halanaeroarchaeum sp. HSR-CO TaxID=2866382 RepID=UPI00217E5252|nr:PGF-CTERM sorting domain-containing protein [Halanaeroarchaeum sp. HSR-CO]UWG46507.1 putative membrane-associated or secreted trancriptional regulator [Halanaeroarchaeum sp. HSR-CO]
MANASLALVVVTVLIAGVGPVAAQDRQTDPAVVVDLDESGTADVTVVMTFDLTADAEREAFATLRTDEAALADLETRFADRMDATASATADRVDRDVVARDASVTLDTVDGGDTGIATLSVTMENLAGVDDGQLTLTEPFASGFTADRPLVVHPPNGYTLGSGDPAPTGQSTDTLTWGADTTFDGFELVLEAEDGETATATPGFGILAGAVALTGTALLGRQRRH